MNKDAKQTLSRWALRAGMLMALLSGCALDASSEEDGIAGETEEESDLASQESALLGTRAAKNCVYIQWCNKSGSMGTVCKRRSGVSCDYDTAYWECWSDINNVCGHATFPADILGTIHYDTSE